MKYWSAVQEALVESGKFTSPAPLYGLPYSDGHRLNIPRGAGNEENAEGFTDYSILDEGPYFSIRTSGRSRANWRDDNPKSWFGTFDDAAKYFVARKSASPTRSRLRNASLEIINRRWLDRGLAPNWAEVSEPDPAGFANAKRYFRFDEPDRYYFTVNPDTATSFLLNLTWREQILTFRDGIPDIERVGVPSFSDG